MKNVSTALMFAALLGASAGVQAITFSYERLAPPPSGYKVTPKGITDGGVVFGELAPNSGGQVQAVVYDRSNGWVPIPGLPQQIMVCCVSSGGLIAINNLSDGTVLLANSNGVVETVFTPSASYKDGIATSIDSMGRVAGYVTGYFAGPTGWGDDYWPGPLPFLYDSGNFSLLAPGKEWVWPGSSRKLYYTELLPATQYTSSQFYSPPAKFHVTSIGPGGVPFGIAYQSDPNVFYPAYISGEAIAYLGNVGLYSASTSASEAGWTAIETYEQGSPARLYFGSGLNVSQVAVLGQVCPNGPDLALCDEAGGYIRGIRGGLGRRVTNSDYLASDRGFVVGPRDQSRRGPMFYSSATGYVPLSTLIFNGASGLSDGDRIVSVSSSGQILGFEGVYSYILTPGDGELGPCDCDLMEGNPINVATGNKFQVENDFSGGLPVSRVYNSQKTDASNIGIGWTLRYSGSRIVKSAGGAFAHRDTGKMLQFDKSGNSLRGGAERLIYMPDDGGYQLIMPEGLIETYAADGKLSAVTSIQGARQVISRAPDGSVASVSDSFGRSVSFDASIAGRFVVTWVDGRTATYGLDDQNRLTSVTYPDGSVKSYVYDDPNRINLLTGIVDEAANRFATWTYDNMGRAITSKHGGSASQVQITYGSGGPEILDPSGATRSKGVVSVLGAMRNVSSSLPAGAGYNASSNLKKFDARGNLSVYDDFIGNRSCMAYTSLTEGIPNLEKVRVEGLTGGASDCAPLMLDGAALPAGARKITTARHPNWGAEIKRAEPLKITTWVYNGQPDPFNGGATASCVTPMYGAGNVPTLPTGHPIAVVCKVVEQATTDADGSQGFGAALDNSDPSAAWQSQSDYTYNQFGQVLSATDPMRRTTSYQYYDDSSFSGNVPNMAGHTKGDLKMITNPLSQSIKFNSYDKAGRVLEQVDANGLVITNEYWPRGWIKKVKRGALTTQYEYWPTGLLKKSIKPDGTYLYFVYDDAHRLTDVTDQVDASGALVGNTLHYTLDSAGNVRQEDVKDTTGTLVRRVSREFDALNRLSKSVGAQQ